MKMCDFIPEMLEEIREKSRSYMKSNSVTEPEDFKSDQQQMLPQPPLVKEPVSDVLVGFEKSARAQAIAVAQEMREQGKRVEMCYERTGEQVAALGAKKGVRRVVYVDARGVHEAPVQE